MVHGFHRSAEAVLDYEAPELFEGCAFDLLKCDIWALGVMLFRLLSGEYPFTKLNSEVKDNSQIERYKRDIIEFYSKSNQAYPQHIDSSCMDLIHKCLNYNPYERISIEEVFEHPWFMVNFPQEARVMNEQILADMKRGALPGSVGGGESSIRRIVLDACIKHPGDSTERYIDQRISDERDTKSANMMSITRSNIYHSDNSGSG